MRSNCRAFTQLGTQPAESIGTYEKELVDAIRDRLPAPSASTPTSAPKQLSEGEAIEPSSTPVESPSGPCDLDVELRKLDRLRVDGLLTDEEFAELKEKLLARCG